MLSTILKEHQTTQQRRREVEETRRIEAVAATNKLSHALVDHLNSGVAQAYINQKKIDSEAKQLQTNAAQFSKQTTAWLTLLDNFNEALKEIGDVENWARSIEGDMRTISSALEYAYKDTQQSIPR